MDARSLLPRLPHVRPGIALRVGAALAMLAVFTTLAAAQSGFRVMHGVARTTETHAEITGTVLNESRAEAVDISVTVEAIGPGGKPLARGITYVARRLPAGGTATFSAKVPVAAGVRSYRASVTSFRFVQSFESP